MFMCRGEGIHLLDFFVFALFTRNGGSVGVVLYLDIAIVICSILQYLHRLGIFSINCTENGECVMTA